MRALTEFLSGAEATSLTSSELPQRTARDSERTRPDSPAGKRYIDRVLRALWAFTQAVATVLTVICSVLALMLVTGAQWKRLAHEIDAHAGWPIAIGLAGVLVLAGVGFGHIGLTAASRSDPRLLTGLLMVTFGALVQVELRTSRLFHILDEHRYVGAWWFSLVAWLALGAAVFDLVSYEVRVYRSRRW